MQTIKIPVPDGFVIDSFDLKSGEVKLKEKPKEVTERIKTVDDVLADNGWTRERFDEWSDQMTEDEKALCHFETTCKITQRRVDARLEQFK